MTDIYSLTYLLCKLSPLLNAGHTISNNIVFVLMKEYRWWGEGVGFMGVSQRWGTDHPSHVTRNKFYSRKKDKESPWGIKSLSAIVVTTARDGLV